MAMIMVNDMNASVVTRAISNIFFASKVLIFLARLGKMSLVITAEIVFESDATMVNVLAKIDARTKPTSPGGKNFITISEYEVVGSAKSGKKIGAANIGKNKISGQSRYKPADKIEAFLALLPDDVDIKRVARFQVPPE